MIVPAIDVNVPSWTDLESRRLKGRQKPLLQSVERWWSTLGSNQSQVISRADYVRLHVAMYRALVPVPWDPERALETAMEDWRFDAGGDDARMISKAKFYQSLYELAETWTPPAAESAPAGAGNTVALMSD